MYQRDACGAYVSRTDIVIDHDSITAVDWCGNVFWLILGGLLMSLQWLLFGALFSITIIGIPCGIVCFKMSRLTLFPFGKHIVNKAPFTMEEDKNCILCCGNIVWLPLGIIFALEHVLFGCIWCITIIGFPFGLQHFKLASVAIWPFSYTLSGTYEERITIITTA